MKRSSLGFLPALPAFAAGMLLTLCSGCLSSRVDQNTSKKIASKKSRIDHVGLANQYAKDGLLREAVTSYKRALKRDANDLTARRNLGLVLVKIGDYKHAAIQLEKATSAFDRDFDTNYFLGEALRGQENFADALFWYKKAIKISPKDPATLKALAWSYFNIRFYSATLKTAKLLLRISPEDSQAAIIISRTYLKLQRPAQAFKVLRRAKQKASEDSLPYLASVEGDIFFNLGKYAEAAKAYKAAIRQQPLLAGALLGLGKYYIHQNKNEKAITFLERAARIRPRMAETYLNLGKAYEKINIKKSIRNYHIFRKKAATDPEYIGLLKGIRKKTAALRRRL